MTMNMKNRPSPFQKRASGFLIVLLIMSGCLNSASPMKDPNRETRQIPLHKVILKMNTPMGKQLGYEQGIRVKDTVYAAGQISLDENGHIIGKGNMATQMRQAYLTSAKILQSFGATMNNVVKEEIFVIDMQAALVVAPTIRNDVYPDFPMVSSTIIQVQRLVHPDALVEITLTAKIRDL